MWSVHTLVAVQAEMELQAQQIIEGVLYPTKNQKQQP